MIPTFSEDKTLSALQAIADTDFSDEDVRHLVLRMQDLLSSGLSTYDIKTLQQALSKDVLINLRGIFDKYSENFESEFANNFMSDETGIGDYPNYEVATRLIKAESKLASIKPGDRVLFIGSGPFPSSAILFASLSGAVVTCFDKSARACDMSRRVTGKLGLANKITILNKSGEDGRLGNQDVIIIALQAEPKELIVQNILRHSDYDSKVIIRRSNSIRQVLYENFVSDQITYPNLVFAGACHVQDYDIISSLYLRPPPTRTEVLAMSNNIQEYNS